MVNLSSKLRNEKVKKRLKSLIKVFALPGLIIVRTVAEVRSLLICTAIYLTLERGMKQTGLREQSQGREFK